MARPREFDRQKAVRVAMHLFWRHGFEGVSVTNLIAAMGISPPSFYAAFRSKMDLYREVLDLYEDHPRLDQALGRNVPVHRALHSLMRVAVRRATKLSPPSGCMICNGSLTVGPELCEVAELTATRRRALVAVLKRRLEQAVRMRELTPRIRPAVLAHYFAAVVHGISVQARDGTSRAELERVAALAVDIALQAGAVKRSGQKRGRVPD